MVIQACVTYTRLLFGRTAGRRSAALVLAPTGGSAHNIKGHTWHSVLGSNMNTAFTKASVLPDKTILQLQADLLGTELVALDEVSLVSGLGLYEIHSRLCAATQVRTLHRRYSITIYNGISSYRHMTNPLAVNI